MDGKQQREALEYFRETAADWGMKSRGDTPRRVNVVKQRNDVVLDVIDERTKTTTALDVGCGTGDLVYEIASKGVRAVGVDFADEMIAIAESVARQLPPGMATFSCCSIFDYPLVPSTYDVISANGFIEYISPDDLDRFLAYAWEALSPGGSLVLGSRNRLFNLYSLNEFTQQESVLGSIDSLLVEALALQNLRAVDDLVGISVLERQEEDIVLADTGIDVTTRYQFTPGQLVDLLVAASFRPLELFPIHVHGVCPTFKGTNPEVHTEIANLLQGYARGALSLLPQSSSFMVHAKKPGG